MHHTIVRPTFLQKQISRGLKSPPPLVWFTLNTRKNKMWHLLIVKAGTFRLDVVWLYNKAQVFANDYCREHYAPCLMLNMLSSIKALCLSRCISNWLNSRQTQQLQLRHMHKDQLPALWTGHYTSVLVTTVPTRLYVNLLFIVSALLCLIERLVDESVQVYFFHFSVWNCG